MNLIHANGSWRYLDSYYGGTDFLGQEVVWFEDRPVWAMNYYGRVLDGQLIDGERAGRVIKASLTMMYREKRFWVALEIFMKAMKYYDESNGDLRSFNGVERIFCNGTEAYRLDYHGGMIVP